jgi:ABC-type phosphate/phosphonate transport system ATPase subunit
MISFTHTYKVFPNGFQGLRDISFTIEKGEFVFLTGPSGAGKTTLFRLISGYDRPSSGAVSVLGSDVAGLKQTQIPYFRHRAATLSGGPAKSWSKSALDFAWTPCPKKFQAESSSASRWPAP